MNTVPTSTSTCYLPSASVSCDKERQESGPPLASNVTAQTETQTEPMDVSLNCRTAVSCQAAPTLRQSSARPDWLTRALSQFQAKATQSKYNVAEQMNGIVNGPLAAELNITAVKEARDVALRHIDRFTEQVWEQFAKEGADNWQGCMDWLIGLPPEEFCCPPLLALLPVELIRLRPDLPQNSLRPTHTAAQLAARSLLIETYWQPACCEEYPSIAMEGNVILQAYLAATSTLRHQLLEAVIQTCLLYTSPSPRDRQKSRMPSSA